MSVHGGEAYARTAKLRFAWHRMWVLGVESTQLDGHGRVPSHAGSETALTDTY